VQPFEEFLESFRFVDCENRRWQFNKRRRHIIARRRGSSVDFERVDKKIFARV
jgi:hypothetical protein